MCCESCPRYEKCTEDNRLKDNCCVRCPEYYDCAGMDAREKDYDRESYEDNENYNE